MRLMWSLALITVVIAGSLSSLRSAEPSPAKPLHVVLVAASGEYKADESLKLLKAHLEKELSARCTLLAAKDGGSDVEGLVEALKTADVLIPFMRRVKLQDQTLEAFKAYCQSGRAIVGVRTASHAVQTWLDFDKEVLGGNYKGHFKTGPICQVRLSADHKDHPVLAGIKVFTSVASLYKNTGLATDCQVLMTGEIPGQSEPLTWVRSHKGGRVFYTSLGHPKDFRNEQFLRLLTNAVKWTTAK